MREAFVPCRHVDPELNTECDESGWLIQKRISRVSGKLEKFCKGRCRCWLEWRARQ